MNKEELLWLRRYNQYCGKFMYKERCRRGISEQKISRGVCTRTEFRKMENGDTPWKKMIGDYLLQRLGVPTEYFEVMADARELNGWRDREDICLVVFEQPQKAQQLLEVYQKKYRKKTPFEEQFLKKMQNILLVQAYKKSFESKSVDVERENQREKIWWKAHGRRYYVHYPMDGKKRSCQSFYWLPVSWKVFCFWQIVCFLSVRQMKLCRCTRR